MFVFPPILSRELICQERSFRPPPFLLFPELISILEPREKVPPRTGGKGENHPSAVGYGAIFPEHFPHAKECQRNSEEMLPVLQGQSP